jgi:hypothetical protein
MRLITPAILGLLALPTVSAVNFLSANPADTDINNEYNPKASLSGDRAFQDFAPEYLEIQPLKVQIITENNLFHQGKSIIKIQADVLQVYRSNSGLKSGQKIQINYERKNSAGFGDTQPTIPAEGVVTAAFLRKEKDQNNFVPAAQQYTFAPLTPEQMERINPRKKLVVSDSAPANAETPAAAPATDIQLRPEESNKAPAEAPLPSK